MFRTFADMFKNKDIRNRIFFTLAMLFVFRFGSAITVPGVDVTELIKGMQDSSLFAMINMLGGGGAAFHFCDGCWSIHYCLHYYSAVIHGCHSCAYRTG